MRVLPTLVTGLAAMRTAQGEYCRPQPLEQRDGPQGFMERLGLSGAQSKAPAPAAPPSGAQILGTRYNKCLDVTSGRLKAGTQVQLWDCDRGNKNQQWKFVGQQLQTAGNMCLDSTGNARVGTHPHLWPCDASNANQRWEMAGMNLRLAGSNQCLDVADGVYSSGRVPQFYPCQWNSNPDATNQHWFRNGQPAKQAAPAAAQNEIFLGYAAISVDRFTQLHPECAPYKSAFEGAAREARLHPTLLAAIAMQESTCRSWVPFGLMQIMNDGVARKHVGTDQGKSVMNPSDAIYGAARYLRELLDQEGQNLNDALRGYNGPIEWGGRKEYQSEIATWMRGGSAY